MNRKSIFVLFALSAFVCLSVWADDECSFCELNGQKDAQLLSSLHDLIVSHTVLDYSAVRGDKSRVDVRDDGTIWDIYSDCSFYPSDYCGTRTDYEECDCYNREHGLPKYWWGGSKDEPMYTDLHHIFSTDFAANTQRSAWAYGEVTKTPVWSNSLGSKVGYGTFGSSGNNYVFEPADEYKGDIARVYFYMITCYLDKNFTQGGKGYQIFNYSGSKASFTDKALTFLLKWHRQDPVSDKETTRDAKIYKKQGNHNPFVHDPALAEYIWGNKKGTAYACSNSQAIDLVPTTNDQIPTTCRKLLRNGQILILRGDKTYDLTGRLVE